MAAAKRTRLFWAFATLLVVTTAAAVATALLSPPAEGVAGVNGRFNNECPPSAQSPQLQAQGVFDPMLAPGQEPNPGGHLHDFEGSDAIITKRANITLADMDAAGTNCVNANNHSLYYWPSLIKQSNGVPAIVSRLFAYYLSANNAAANIEPIPRGLNIKSTSKDWSCGDSTFTANPPQTCPNKLKLRVRFPNCWDGVHLDSANHSSHMANQNATTKLCPGTHPVPIPKLEMHAIWLVPGIAGHKLSSDTTSQPAGASGHANVIFDWEQPEIQWLNDNCLEPGIDCNTMPAQT